MDKVRHCAGVRKDGSPCGSQVLSDGTHCYVHSPGRAADRAEARQRGGRNRATARRLRGMMPDRLRPIFDQLEAALAEVHDGELDPKAASAMAALARALVAVLTSGELEERLRRLEEGTGTATG